MPKYPANKWHLNNPERERNRKYKYNYNMTLEEYEFLLEQQDYHCALCLKTPEENGKRLAVDHDHICCPGRRSCGKCIRGLLCFECNKSVDWFANYVDRVALYDYLGEESP